MLRHAKRKATGDVPRPSKEAKTEKKHVTPPKTKYIVPSQEGDCPICLGPYKKRNYKIECPYMCGLEACLNCHFRYLMSSSHNAHCMGDECRREWSWEFVEDYFTPTKVKNLRDHRKKVLVARDRAYLPEAQHRMELIHKRNQLQIKLDKMRREQEQVEMEMRCIRREFDGRSSELKDEYTKEKLTKCPLEDCRGFLRVNLCGVCGKKICLKCMREKVEDAKNEDESKDEREEEDEEEDEEESLTSSNKKKKKQKKNRHKCNPEDVANVDYIKKNSKPCPKCGYRTSKVSGCDQMFCIDCHTAWNWDTGRIERGIIHNPHFFEWQRQHQGRVERNPQDIVCGGLPNVMPWEFMGRTRDKFNPVLRAIHHVRENRITYNPYIRQGRGPPVQKDNTDIRIKFLEKKIDEQKWGGILMNRNRAYRKHESYHNIHQMFVLAGTDIMQKVLAAIYELRRLAIRSGLPVRNELGPELLGLYNELKELRKYYNYQLMKTSKKYKDSRGVFFELVTPQWNFVRANEKNLKIYKFERESQKFEKPTKTRSPQLTFDAPAPAAASSSSSSLKKT